MIENHFDVTEAKLDVLENWKKNNVLIEIDNGEQEVISVRRILPEKTQKGFPKVKARLGA